MDCRPYRGGGEGNPKRLVEAASLAFPTRSIFLTIRGYSVGLLGAKTEIPVELCKTKQFLLIGLHILDLHRREEMQMTTNLNPDPHADGFTPQPIYNVTAVFDELHDVISAVRSLKQSAFPDEQTSVFMGKEGLAKLDLHGEDHGVLARVIRALESLTAEDQANRNAEVALNEGRIFITVQTDGSDEQKETVERVLKAHKAHTLRFFGHWTVERL